MLAEKLAGHSLSTTQKKVAAESIHWGFGALTGAAYGGLAEYFPAATQKEGASFGLALATLTHGKALPAFGISPAARTTRPCANTPAKWPRTSSLVSSPRSSAAQFASCSEPPTHAPPFDTCEVRSLVSADQYLCNLINVPPGNLDTHGTPLKS